MRLFGGVVFARVDVVQCSIRRTRPGGSPTGGEATRVFGARRGRVAAPRGGRGARGGGRGRGRGAGDGRGQVRDAHADAGHGGGASAVAGKRQLDAAATSAGARRFARHAARRDTVQGDGVHHAGEGDVGGRARGVERDEGELVDVLPVRRGFGGFRGELLRPVVRREPFVASPLVPLVHEHVDRVPLARRLVVLGVGFGQGVAGVRGADGGVDPGIDSGLADSVFWFFPGQPPVHGAVAADGARDRRERGGERAGGSRSGCRGRGGRGRARGREK
mmetsp:Transcript_9275/g.36055  ORF Transcript_9275/g.36055 Transcript_9275/m.36055 type:complete len:276 (+) Transcript_9275:717-1544(+)